MKKLYNIYSSCAVGVAELTVKSNKFGTYYYYHLNGRKFSFTGYYENDYKINPSSQYTIKVSEPVPTTEGNQHFLRLVSGFPVQLMDDSLLLKAFKNTEKLLNKTLDDGTYPILVRVNIDSITYYDKDSLVYVPYFYILKKADLQQLDNLYHIL